MNLEGMGPCLAVEGTATATVFEAYVEQVLAPSLRRGQIVVLDNLSAHKSERRARKLIEERGGQLLFLPRRTRRTSTPSRKPSRRSRAPCERPKPEPTKP